MHKHKVLYTCNIIISKIILVLICVDSTTFYFPTPSLNIGNLVYIHVVQAINHVLYADRGG